MLEPFGSEMWLASGPTLSVAGFRYPTRMAIIRLNEDKLFVWSPVALSDDLREAVDGLGDVAWLVAPNTLHDRFLAEWRQAYPYAELFAPSDLIKARMDLHFSGNLSSGGTHPWSDGIVHAVIEGNWIATEAVFFHIRSRTILFTDMIQQFNPHWFTGWRSLITMLDGMVGTEPRVPRKFRYAFFSRRRARAALRTILAWPADRLVMAHGLPLRQDAQAAVRQAFRWLVS